MRIAASNALRLRPVAAFKDSNQTTGLRELRPHTTVASQSGDSAKTGLRDTLSVLPLNAPVRATDAAMKGV